MCLLSAVEVDCKCYVELNRYILISAVLIVGSTAKLAVSATRSEAALAERIHGESVIISELKVVGDKV